MLKLRLICVIGLVLAACGPEEDGGGFDGSLDGLRRDGGDGGIVIIDPNCKDPTKDSDNDTISDCTEGSLLSPPRDSDKDGTPDYLDDDSDNDCVKDKMEAGDSDVLTIPVNSDGQGSPDYLDKDSDNDGLIDTQEDTNCNGLRDQATCETDRINPDTDNDAINDLIEVQACQLKPEAQRSVCMCDGTNASVNPRDRGDFVFVVDYQTNPAPDRSTLQFTTDIAQADIVYAFDTTGSMAACAENTAESISSQVIPKTKEAIGDVAMGLVQFRDFWRNDKFVVNYDHRIQTVKTAQGVASIQQAFAAINNQTIGDGGFGRPEAGWEALFAIAGGGRAISMSINWPDAPGYGGPKTVIYNSQFNLGSVPPLTPVAGEVFGGEYGAGFRAGAVPIIVAVTDTEFHDAPNTPVSGENGRFPYALGAPCPLNDQSCDDCNRQCADAPSRSETMSRLNAIGARAIGLAVQPIYPQEPGDAKRLSRALSTETNSRVTPADFGTTTRPANCASNQCCTGYEGAGEPPDGDGLCPLAFSVSRSPETCPVSDALVTAITALAKGAQFDVHIEASDVDPSTVDNFMDRLEPNLSGTGSAMLCITMPNPALQDNYTGPKATIGADQKLDTFPLIRTSRVCFDVIPKTNTTVQNSDVPQIFRARLQVKGVVSGQSYNLGIPREVYFLVPPKNIDIIM